VTYLAGQKPFEVIRGQRGQRGGGGQNAQLKSRLTEFCGVAVAVSKIYQRIVRLIHAVPNVTRRTPSAI